ncbi:type II toxin-antitoxin system ParD family antitoxin [Chroococcidiopsis sp. FACHB-1243]|uniref:ribbon-helix-helix domain-containing protein n=1 Tax=Chroococcidiopsis sp. [FACHB-1243] TaxID=2692781 RepID=UPI00177DDBF4|nr:type II toxin-antitoxin system ParD family antitoxin [Chroococcidiopsis sp. [FACHB-1243]]MBD2308102.1 type II toxin-antitoxin system ParD family antitoxin [Chroococcidiopsis sp. [FACHB-1243]]
MNITLKPEQEKIVQILLASGKFKNVDEVIQAALHLLEEDDREYQQWMIETRAKVEEGIASLERGEGIDGETFVNQLLTKFKQVREAQQ